MATPPCKRRNPHTPHGTCLGTAPEFPSEAVEYVTTAGIRPPDHDTLAADAREGYFRADISAAIRAADHVSADARENSYRTDLPPGVHDVITASVTSYVVGANGRRLLVAEMPEGVYVGGVLISDVDDLAEFAGLLAGLALARAH